MTTEDDAQLAGRLNLETGRLQWRELQRHFARGSVLVVAPGLDLIEVAVRLARDDSTRLRDWLERGLVVAARDDHAQAWEERQAAFWALVVAPWVLVQEIHD